MKLKCIISGCNDRAHARDLCPTHYGRVHRRKGSAFTLRRAKGTGTINASGYVVFNSKGVLTYEHTIFAERALGKPLPKGAIVHHMNDKPADNYTPFNLVICPNQAYHFLLHKRTEEYKRFGRCITKDNFWAKKADVNVTRKD